MTASSDIVVVDAAPFLARSSSRLAEAKAIRHACRDCGFFYVSGHGVSETLLARLEAQSHAFFALPLSGDSGVGVELAHVVWVDGDSESSRTDPASTLSSVNG